MLLKTSLIISHDTGFAVWGLVARVRFNPVFRQTQSRLSCRRQWVKFAAWPVSDLAGPALEEIKIHRMTTIIVKQNAIAAPHLADGAIILDMGQVVFDGTAHEVLGTKEPHHEYLAIQPYELVGRVLISLLSTGS